MKKADKWKERLKRVILFIGVMGFVLAIASVYVGVKGISDIRPASDYEDMGVHAFYPYRVLPVQVKNNATGRARRGNRTRTVYRLYYRTLKGTSYKWSVECGSKDEADRILADGETVERRVLYIREDRATTTVKPNMTADTYVKETKQQYRQSIAFSIGYVVFYISAWIIWIIVKRRRRNIKLFYFAGSKHEKR